MPKISNHILLKAGCLAFLFLSASILRSDETLETFQQRREWLIDTVSANPQNHLRYPFFTAQCCFKKGKIEEGKKIARNAYLDLPKHRVRQVEMFVIWPAMDCYLRWGHLLDEESKEALKKVVTNTTYFGQTRTCNLVTLARVIRYLGSEAWGEEAFVPEAAWRKNDTNAREALMEQLDSIARWGLGEYASRPYMTYNLFPILTLAECAKDPEIKKRAAIAFETALAQFAPCWLQGSLCVASGRSYPDILCLEPSGSARAFWMYFGGPAKARITNESMAPAVMNYTPNPIITIAGTDRSKAYTAKSHHWSQLQITYMNRTYALFCEMQYGERQNKSIWQTYPYGVMWLEPDTSKSNFLWLTVPGGEKTGGSGPHGVIGTAQSNIQHEDALLYVCETEKEDIPFRHALCFVPGGWKASINESKDGKIFLHYGTVLIAITSTEAFEWKPDAGLANFKGYRKDDSEFRIKAAKFAVAIETAPPDEFPGSDPQSQLKAYRNTIVSKCAVKLDENDQPFAGSYTDRKGVTIRRVFKGDATINGKRMVLETWPMLDNPWMFQKYGGDLTIHDNKTARHYNLKTFTVTEEPLAAWLARKNAKWPGFKDGKVEIASLPSLELWLDASNLKEGTLDVWPDLSGKKNDAKTIANKYIQCKSPVVVSDAINGKPAVRFSDSRPGCGMTTGKTFLPDKTLDVFMVVRSDEGKGQEGSVFAYQGLSYYRDTIEFAKIRNNGDESSSIIFGIPLNFYKRDISGIAQDIWQNKKPGIIRTMINSDGTSAISVNGGKQVIYNKKGWLDNLNRPFLVGTDNDYRYFPQCFLNGDIAEIIVCSEILDETTAEQIEKYLSGKWNIGLGE